MSFILDALKKSESDRQRQTGPALFEVKVTPPKARLPPWAIAIGVLLAVNLIIVGWLLLRRAPHAEDTAPVAAIASAPVKSIAQAGVQVESGPASAPTQIPSSTSPTMPPRGMSAENAGAPSPSSATAGVGGSENKAADGPTPNGPTDEPTLAGNGAGPVSLKKDAVAANTAAGPAGVNPDDYTPATDPTSGAPFKGHVKRGIEGGYTLYQDAAVAPGANLPNLRLDLHVYAAKPEDRFALINMHRMREGDSTPEGVRVESITPEGVVMSHNGTTFLLPRD